MGFLNKLMGVGTAGSESKKEEIRQIFNSTVQNGESYTVVACMHMAFEKKLLKDVYTYYNYLVGYKDGDDPEIVIISTTHDLTSLDEPVYCKKSECTKAYYDPQGMYVISHPQLDADEIKFTVIPSTAWGGYIISVSYLDEATPFWEFFQKRFEKKG